MARFQKGHSGNPGGRPRVLAEVQELAGQYTVEAIKTLAAIMRDKKAPAAARALASNSILDRRYGKPAQTIDANVNRKSPDDMTDAELLAIAGAADDEDRPDDTARTTKHRIIN